jgi:Coenzyme PQQ synthesis protein D (PqqD)
MRGEYPRARRAGLLVETVGDEVLVYDTERHRAHALNDSAAKIWKRCDGKTSAAEIAGGLSEALQMPVTEDFVRHGLAQLREFHLLDEPAGSMSAPDSGPSRRELIRVGGLAALALPLITSIVAPVAAEAQSGGGSGTTTSTGATG